MSDQKKKARWPLTLAAFLATIGVIAAAIWGPGAKKNGGVDPALAQTVASAVAPTSPATTATVVLKRVPSLGSSTSPWHACACAMVAEAVTRAAAAGRAKRRRSMQVSYANE